MAETFAPAPVDVERLRAEVKLKYRDVATDPGKGFHFHVGRPLAEMLEYPMAAVDSLPPKVVESFAGVNNPFSMGELKPGERVLDIGSGAGFDSILAAQMVGPSGHVTGVDMTPEMRAKARANAHLVGLGNVEFIDGLAEQLPLADQSVDVAISNGVINLCPDKLAVYREVHRVLTPGGRIQIADVVVQKPLPPDAVADIDLWTGWIAGALLVEEYTKVVKAAGFTKLRVGCMVDVFSGSAHESDAKDYDTRGIVFSAAKPV